MGRTRLPADGRIQRVNVNEIYDVVDYGSDERLLDDLAWVAEQYDIQFD